MFGDIGWAEMLLIGVVALVVIGPEDLPDMFRQLGRFTAKLRQMSREFSRAMEQAGRDSGVKDVAKDLRALTSPAATGLNKVKEAADRFEKWDPIKNAAKPTVAAKPAAPAQPVVPASVAPDADAVAVPAAVPVPAAPTVPVPAAPAVPVAVPVGAQTQALFDKKAAKAAILQDTAEKLKAVDQGRTHLTADLTGNPTKLEQTAATAPRKARVDAASQAEPVAAKPRAPRKTKKADEA